MSELGNIYDNNTHSVIADGVIVTTRLVSDVDRRRTQRSRPSASDQRRQEQSLVIIVNSAFNQEIQLRQKKQLIVAT